MQVLNNFLHSRGLTVASSAIAGAACINILGNAIATKKTDDLCYGLFYGLAAMNFYPGSARTAALFLATRSTYETWVNESENLCLIERIVANVLGVAGALGFCFGFEIYKAINRYMESDSYKQQKEGTIPLSILCIAIACHFIKSRYRGSCQVSRSLLLYGVC